jgi:ornithine cyclodeaminase
MLANGEIFGIDVLLLVTRCDPVLILSQDDIATLLPPPEVIAAVEAAVISHAHGHVVVPKRAHVEWDGNTLLLMPAAAPDAVGTKLVSVVPGNATRALPVTSGLMVMNDRATGEPIALMNAAALTAQRTGAVGALGVKHMTREDISSVGIIGCGVQGTWQAIYACAVRPISDVLCFGRSAVAVEKFAAMVTRHVPRVRVVACTDVRQLLERTHLVITATTSAEPVLPDEPSLLEGKQFISVGSFRPTMQELPDSVYRLAGSVIVDSEHARHEVGDVINPLNRGILRDTAVVPISDYVTGKRVAERQPTVVYKSVGAAFYDLYVARAMYRAARARGVGLEVAL